MLVRHGQASPGAGGEAALSWRGVRQGRKVGATLAGYGVDPTTLIHGGMRRHQETAEAVLSGSGWELPATVDDRWREIDHLALISAYPTVDEETREKVRTGKIEPRAFWDLYSRAAARWSSGAYDAEYPESFVEFMRRVRDGIGHAARQAGDRRTAIVVTSGGPIAAACAMLTEVGEKPVALASAWARFNAVVVNSSVTRVVVGASGARLLTFNEHSWLDRELVTYR